MNLRLSTEVETERSSSTTNERPSDRFMIVVPEALHSFPVSLIFSVKSLDQLFFSSHTNNI